MKTGQSAQSPFVTVDLPCSHEGVGRALRSAYKSETAMLPQDMLALLNQLDRH